MNVDAAARAVTIDKFKSEIVRFMVINPETAGKQGMPDSVRITDVGRLLYELSKAGYNESRELISNVMAGMQDENFENFLQAYCYIYGYDFTRASAYYDRFGRPSYSEYYKALRQYLSAYGDYLLDEPGEDEPPGGFIKFIKNLLKKLSAYIKSN